MSEPGLRDEQWHPCMFRWKEWKQHWETFEILRTNPWTEWLAENEQNAAYWNRMVGPVTLSDATTAASSWNASWGAAFARHVRRISDFANLMQERALFRHFFAWLERDPRKIPVTIIPAGNTRSRDSGAVPAMARRNPPHPPGHPVLVPTTEDAIIDTGRAWCGSTEVILQVPLDLVTLGDWHWWWNTAGNTAVNRAYITWQWVDRFHFGLLHDLTGGPITTVVGPRDPWDDRTEWCPWSQLTPIRSMAAGEYIRLWTPDHYTEPDDADL